MPPAGCRRSVAASLGVRSLTHRHERSHLLSVAGMQCVHGRIRATDRTGGRLSSSAVPAHAW